MFSNARLELLSKAHLNQPLRKFFNAIVAAGRTRQQQQQPLFTRGNNLCRSRASSLMRR
jgi:hypothetical protein